MVLGVVFCWLIYLSLEVVIGCFILPFLCPVAFLSLGPFFTVLGAYMTSIALILSHLLKRSSQKDDLELDLPLSLKASLFSGHGRSPVLVCP